MSKKTNFKINYLFFFIFLIISSIIATLNILEIKNTTLGSKIFFLVYAYGQTILEIFALVLFSWVIYRFLPKAFFYMFIGLSFVFFISHIIDFGLLKIMDMTFFEGLDIALDEDLENFIEMLHVTGIPFYAWALFGLLAIALPFAGIFIYKLTNKISLNKKIRLHNKSLVKIFFIIPAILVILDLKASTTIDPNVYANYIRNLPWKITLYQPKTLTIDIPLALKSPKNNLDKILVKKDLKIDKKPNIFIFIIESLRSDYITEDIAPNLYKFMNKNTSFDLALSNGNNSHHAWFALFYSEYSLYWKHYKDLKTKIGSPSLYLFNKIGYDTNVFTAPDLIYYSMKDILFGKDCNLVKNFKFFPHYHPVQACDSDILVIDEMKKSLKKDKNVYIAFLDSTHFLYSWPKDFETKFKPISEIEYISSYSSKINIELVKNRYKNSIHFVDSLIGSFFDHLKEQNLFEDSIIVILGDHGEEFYDQGHLFHASHLSSQQTNIPIYFKLGQNQREVKNTKLISQMDIFPTIFDYLFKKNELGECFKGKSIFEKTISPFVISTRYNASRAPYEFFIHTQEEKLTLRFKKRKKIFQKQNLEVVSLKDKNDKPIKILSKNKFFTSFKQGINKLFGN